ncbi:hypothetical protein APHAL10511_005407 [Amanita phalloides]|nr:hypothetical protein APHAL10511_005407 [Amanita phalloides]
MADVTHTHAPNGRPVKDQARNDDAIYRTSPTTTTTHFLESGKEKLDTKLDHPQVEPQPTSGPATQYPYIPHEERSSKVLVLCFDGTGDQFDSDNSNIVQFVSMLKKDDKQKQMVYYQAGIGTYVSPAVATPFMSKMSKILDEMLAWNINAHVMGGYEFLMQNYIAGDRICIFGFSRGAYTARSLAGMIHKIGLLPADNHQQVPFAYKMYTRTDTIGWDQSKAFKTAFSVHVPIEFIGVWDTVDSVGLIPKRLPFTTSNTIVKTFRHAVSLDEHRVKFKANLWNRPTKEEEKMGMCHEELQRCKMDEEHDKTGHPCAASSSMPGSPLSPHKSEGSSGQYSPTKEDGSDDDDLRPKKHNPHRAKKILTLDAKSDQDLNRNEERYSHGNVEKTNVEEVWFAGCHCDIGGGSVENGTRYSLARIPLRWMVRECFKAKTGILFNTTSLFDIGLDPNSVYPQVHCRPEAFYDRAKMQVIERPPSSKPFLSSVRNLFRSYAAKIDAMETDKDKTSRPKFISEEDEELRDALSPKFDQLKMKWFWWILEVLPLSMRSQKDDDQWVSYIGVNMGQGRSIPDSNKAKVHRSVKLRREAQCVRNGDKYRPRADIDLDLVTDWIA